MPFFIRRKYETISEKRNGYGMARLGAEHDCDYRVLFCVRQHAISVPYRLFARRNRPDFRIEGESDRAITHRRFQRILRNHLLFLPLLRRDDHLSRNERPDRSLGARIVVENPYRGNRSEVKVNRLSRREWCLFLSVSAGVTVAFYFILRALGTANLLLSSLSVLTSFTAAYPTARRSRFYAIAYAFNDLVLIALWSMASYENVTYLPMVVCFVSFLATDFYGFLNWSRMTRRQREKEEGDSNYDG